MPGNSVSGKSGCDVCSEKDSPLISENLPREFYCVGCSCILKYTKTVCYIDDREIAEITADSIRFYDVDQEQLQKEFKTVEWDAKAAEKEGFEHFMLKEIYEQPKAVQIPSAPELKMGKL